MPVEKETITQYRWKCSRCDDATRVTRHEDLPPGWCTLVRSEDHRQHYTGLSYDLCTECTTQWNDRFLTGEQLTDV